MRGGGLVPTSQATIRWINDSSKCVPIVKFAVQKLQVDAVSFGGKFPAGYPRPFRGRSTRRPSP